MITDPREALAEQNQVVTALVGLAALGRCVRALAAGTRCPAPTDEADDLIHLLLAVARLGDAVERLVPVTPSGGPAGDERATPATPRQLLR
jgi:hypothetical protein